MISDPALRELIHQSFDAEAPVDLAQRARRRAQQLRRRRTVTAVAAAIAATAVAGGLAFAVAQPDTDATRIAAAAGPTDPATSTAHSTLPLRSEDSRRAQAALHLLGGNFTLTKVEHIRVVSNAGTEDGTGAHFASGATEIQIQWNPQAPDQTFNPVTRSLDPGDGTLLYGSRSSGAQRFVAWGVQRYFQVVIAQSGPQLLSSDDIKRLDETLLEGR